MGNQRPIVSFFVFVCHCVFRVAGVTEPSPEKTDLHTNQPQHECIHCTTRVSSDVRPPVCGIFSLAEGVATFGRCCLAGITDVILILVIFSMFTTYDFYR